MEDYRMEQFQTREPFASFLPGIAGLRGIPMWCYYVNRGQGVVSFGVRDKDHAIMEFYPAHTACQVVNRMGFRTFIRTEGSFAEAFSEPEMSHSMDIGMNSMSITDEGSVPGLKVRVTYFILPEEPLAALIRKVELKNISDREISMEFLDGMPAMIPYGVDMTALKEMAETSKAWMQAETLGENVGYFRVRASMEDSARVSSIVGGNFAFGVDEQGKRLHLFFDPAVLFSYDQAFTVPLIFREQGLSGLFRQKQNRSNEVPCAFFAQALALRAGEMRSFYEAYGQVETQKKLREYLEEKQDGAYFEGKHARSVFLSDELGLHIKSRTASRMFDAYSAYTYMDNVLRGGYPIPLGHNKVFYVYSRKHGDLERDYNYFSMLPEFYSQGNGNFRDVNQNRRNDPFFTPLVEAENIHIFYNLLQPDGYNPLGVEMQTFRIEEEKARGLIQGLTEEETGRILSVIRHPFTPGELAASTDGELFSSIIDFSESRVEGKFGEGYWSDHWDYNLDLIEDYLAVYPEKEEALLKEQDYTWFMPQVRVNPRAKRYEKTENGIRQYHALKEGDFTTEKKEVTDGKGRVLQASLTEKLLVMTTLKTATLDPYGMGVEMEGGKPGWYDALNGLPGMLGSSMPESCELLRMAVWLRSAVQKYHLDVEVFEEAGELMNALDRIIKAGKEKIRNEEGTHLFFWNAINDAKEEYRAKIYEGVSGEKTYFSERFLDAYLSDIIEVLEMGIKRAALTGEVFPTYFYYEVTSFDEGSDGIRPTGFKMHRMPLFLEGPVRYLKLPLSREQKSSLYQSVRKSRLYDEKLSMYKVNANLSDASIEIGRCRSFTPGWLENESIWLHMEYKYLLELLKSGLYEEFFRDFKNACVAFLDSETYGRNPLENSSFIASSANPDEKKWGRGFVARLSGSTAEFLSMWRRLFFGEHPFLMENGELCFRPEPILPDYLIPEDGRVEARLLGSVTASFHLERKTALIPGQYQIREMTLRKGKQRKQVKGDRLSGQDALSLRNGEFTEIDIFLQ